MDYTNKIGRILNENDDIAVASYHCDVLMRKEIKDVSIKFAEWLIYQDDVFDKYVCNKISIDKLFIMFLDELKL